MVCQLQRVRIVLSKLAPLAVLDFAGGALNPAFDQRDAARPFGNPLYGSPQQATGYK